MIYLNKHEIEDLLDDSRISSLIDLDKYTELYEYLNTIMKNDIGKIGEFTEFILSAGINPLEYVDSVPMNFLCYTEKTFNITIPENIKNIGWGAFRRSNITNVKFTGNNLEYIGKYAFKDCYYLNHELVIPEGVEIIDDSAFFNSGIQTLILPKTLYEIGSKITTPRKCKVIYNGSEEDLNKIRRSSANHIMVFDSKNRYIGEI